MCFSKTTLLPQTGHELGQVRMISDLLSQMAMQLGQAGVDINAVLAGQQRPPQQPQHQAALQPQLQQQPSGGQQQLGRLPSTAAPQQQRGATPPQQQGWQGANQVAAALNPGSREFRPGQGLPGQQHPAARAMVSR